MIKKEIDQKRERQKRMREERDHHYKNVTTIKNREEEIKKRTSGRQNRIESLKKGIILVSVELVLRGNEHKEF